MLAKGKYIMRRMPYIILRKQYIIKEPPAPPEGFPGWRCLSFIPYFTKIPYSTTF